MKSILSIFKTLSIIYQIEVQLSESIPSES